ncbi:MAG: alanine glycine permease [Zetaproteobacteria bacterium]|nr:alanine glycine permease [Pseudobdellovibrionaceae bacterium]|tara:strand:- start:75 stop:1592 length:1518 start_codon:yes stop_codon:yes gene_type:complete
MKRFLHTKKIYFAFFSILSFMLGQSYLAFASEDRAQSFINNTINTINSYWGSFLFWNGHPLKLPLILVIMAFGGVFFTFRYWFVNLTLFKHALEIVSGKYDKKEDQGEITHFQALTSALSATVGLGNIAGVAVAISLGGPGAVFWLWIVAFFGMSMKFSSCTFAQLHRILHSDGKVLGGPMVYLDQGFKSQLPNLHFLGKFFAVLFATFTIGASLGGGNMFQGNQTFEILVSQFPSLENTNWIVGIVLAVLVGIVIIGGIQRIGDVTSRLVPFMCGFYCLGCLMIIISNVELVPHLLGQIFYQAFSPDAMWAGGFIGVLTQGVKRASFSNEAGLGSAAIAHAAAKTDKPIREGLVAMLEPFIDTHLVCTMTALSILITNAHLEPALAGKGAAITAQAFSSLGSFMPMLLALATAIFAYSTMISWSYYGEKGCEYLFGRSSIPYYQVVYVFCVVLGPVASLENVIEFSDLMLLSMAFPNIIGMVFLSKKIKSLLEEYKNERKLTGP